MFSSERLNIFPPPQENTVFDAKRLIGRTLNDPALQHDMSTWPFRVVPESPGSSKPLIRVTIDGADKDFRPEEISAMVLEVRTRRYYDCMQLCLVLVS